MKGYRRVEALLATGVYAVKPPPMAGWGALRSPLVLDEKRPVGVGGFRAYAISLRIDARPRALDSEHAADPI